MINKKKPPDKNACKNILYLGKYFLENQLRPKEFSPKPNEKKVIIKQRKNKTHYLEFRNSLMSKTMNIFLSLKSAFKIRTALNY